MKEMKYTEKLDVSVKVCASWIQEISTATAYLFPLRPAPLFFPVRSCSALSHLAGVNKQGQSV